MLAHQKAAAALPRSAPQAPTRSSSVRAAGALASSEKVLLLGITGVTGR
jgi:hypothetical protein